MSQQVVKNTRFAFLGELLVEHGTISLDQLDLAINEQKRRKARLGEILIDSGFCTEEDIAKCLGDQLHLEVRSLKTEDVDIEIAAILGDEMMRRFQLLPLKHDEEGVQIALVDPFDVDAFEAVESATDRAVSAVVATPSEIFALIDDIRSTSSGVDDLLSKKHDDGTTDTSGVSAEVLLQRIVEEAVRQGATDIHIEPDLKVLRLRFRVDGIMAQGPVVNRELADALIARIKVVANLDISERRLPQDGRARLIVDKVPFDLRISTLPTVVGENVVMRILDTRKALMDIRELGLSEANYATVKQVTERPHGLFLVTGPTGSGKSTTLYSLLRAINAMEKKIITVEDPVEYQLPLIRQVQVKSDIGMTFAAALRSILRQDPDVILVGEIRDRETAEICVRAALTGHLVFSTLHTNTAAGAIPRLIDMGIDPFLLRSCLAGMMAQRLVRKVCSFCGIDRPLNPDERAALAPDLAETTQNILAPHGCERCHETGYRGRVAIHEVISFGKELAKLDLSTTSTTEVAEIAAAKGFRSLHADGQAKVLQGLTSLQEVKRVAFD